MNQYAKIAALLLRRKATKGNPAFPWYLSSPLKNMGQTTMPVRLREMARAGYCGRINENGKTAFYLTVRGVKLAKAYYRSFEVQL